MTILFPSGLFNLGENKGIQLVKVDFIDKPRKIIYIIAYKRAQNTKYTRKTLKLKLEGWMALCHFLPPQGGQPRYVHLQHACQD